MVKTNPASIEVRKDSILYSNPGQEVVINFEVTNNLYKRIIYIFEVYTEDNSLDNEIFITPQRYKQHYKNKYILNLNNV